MKIISIYDNKYIYNVKNYFYDDVEMSSMDISLRVHNCPKILNIIIKLWVVKIYMLKLFLSSKLCYTIYYSKKLEISMEGLNINTGKGVLVEDGPFLPILATQTSPKFHNYVYSKRCVGTPPVQEYWVPIPLTHHQLTKIFSKFKLPLLSNGDSHNPKSCVKSIGCHMINPFMKWKTVSGSM